MQLIHALHGGLWLTACQTYYYYGDLWLSICQTYYYYGGGLWLTVCQTGVLYNGLGELSVRHITVSWFIDKCLIDRLLDTGIGLLSARLVDTQSAGYWYWSTVCQTVG